MMFHNSYILDFDVFHPLRVLLAFLCSHTVHTKVNVL